MKAIEAVTIFKNLQELKKKSLPVKISFAITRNLKKLAGEAEAFDEARMGIIRKYAKKKDNGDFDADAQGNVIIENPSACNAEIKELCEERIEVIDFAMISLEELERCDGDQFDSLTPADVETLDFMISE